MSPFNLADLIIPRIWSTLHSETTFNTRSLCKSIVPQVWHVVNKFITKNVQTKCSKCSNVKVCPYHHKVCSKFQGKLAVTESDEDYKRCDILHVFQIHWVPNLEQGWEKSFTKSHILGVGFASQMFTRLVVKNNGVIYECLCLIEEGEWVDYETREAPTHQIPWFFISEPTGYTGKFNPTLA